MPTPRSAAPSPALLAWLLLAVAALPAGAQDHGVAVFEGRTHRFEPLPEGAFAQHAFRFRNEGNAPIRITDVRPSCGCTTPEWTSDPVAPGESGSVIALYATEGRPGPFRRDIVVETDGEPARLVLYIEGEVVPPSVDLATASIQGNLALNADTFDFGSVEPGSVTTHTFYARNTGSRPIRILDARAESQILGVRFTSHPIFPEEVSRISITLYPTAEGPASVEIPVEIVTDDADAPGKRLTIRASVAGSSSDSH